MAISYPLTDSDYAYLNELMFPRVGIFYVDTPADSALWLVDRFKERTPHGAVVGIQYPGDRTLKDYCHKAHYWYESFPLEEESRFFDFCTHVVFVTKNKRYEPPLQWAKRNRPTRIVEV